VPQSLHFECESKGDNRHLRASATNGTAFAECQQGKDDQETRAVPALFRFFFFTGLPPLLGTRGAKVVWETN
jgi:hypothetical protein